MTPIPSYKQINPILIKIGDIVELSVTFAVYSGKNSKYRFVPHLKGILLVDQEARNVSRKNNDRYKLTAYFVDRKHPSLR